MSDGFKILESQLGKYIAKASKVQDILIKGAESFSNDAKKLPQPMSKIRKPGYTHLVHSIGFKKSRRNNEVEVGSKTEYYLHFVEQGTTKMSGRLFLKKLYERNKSKYNKIMLEELRKGII